MGSYFEYFDFKNPTTNPLEIEPVPLEVSEPRVARDTVYFCSRPCGGGESNPTLITAKSHKEAAYEYAKSMVRGSSFYCKVTDPHRHETKSFSVDVVADYVVKEWDNV